MSRKGRSELALPGLALVEISCRYLDFPLCFDDFRFLCLPKVALLHKLYCVAIYRESGGTVSDRRTGLTLDIGFSINNKDMYHSLFIFMIGVVQEQGIST